MKNDSLQKRVDQAVAKIKALPPLEPSPIVLIEHKRTPVDLEQLTARAVEKIKVLLPLVLAIPPQEVEMK